MSASDKLAQLKQTAQNDVAVAQSAVESKQVVVDLIASYESEKATEDQAALTAAKQDGFNEGLGQAGKTADDGLFSQNEIDEKVAAALAPMQAQITDLSAQLVTAQTSATSLQNQVADLQAQVAAAADKTAAAVLKAVSDVKMGIAADIENVEKDNMELAARLKSEAAPVVVSAPVEQPVEGTPAN